MIRNNGLISDCDVTDDCFETKVNSAHQQAQVGNLKLDLPLDEDDYLMPSPQLPANKTQYMDLIGESKPTGERERNLLLFFHKLNFIYILHIIVNLFYILFFSIL